MAAVAMGSETDSCPVADMNLLTQKKIIEVNVAEVPVEGSRPSWRVTATFKTCTLSGRPIDGEVSQKKVEARLAGPNTCEDAIIPGTLKQGLPV